MNQAILVLNAGSSSIKFSLFDILDGTLAAGVRGQVEGLFNAPHFKAVDSIGKTVEEKSWGEGVTLGHEGAVEHLLGFVGSELEGQALRAVGHRVVHGGAMYSQAVVVSAGIIDSLASLVPLAPLHQPHNLAPMRILLARMPALPQVACFDTAFHCSNPDVARRFAVPAELHDEGVRRYGFHGISYEYIASVLPDVDPRGARGKTVVLHLGNGASMCALDCGRSIATTMGLTPLDGLPMGTRCGSIDPGVLLYLMDRHGMDARALEKLLYFESGLKGVSAISSDMRALLASADPRARLAVDLYVYRIGRELGSLAAALHGLDCIVFTAGIGENAAPIRERVLRDAAWLGVELDAKANAADVDRLSAPSSRVSAWRMRTNEELMIARQTRALLGL